MSSLLGYYGVVINIIALTFTVYDKWASRHLPTKRTKEATLLLISTLGGSPGMFLTMILIGHKIRHAKFMLGLPILFLIQFFLLKNLGLIVI